MPPPFSRYVLPDDETHPVLGTPAKRASMSTAMKVVGSRHARQINVKLKRSRWHDIEPRKASF